jgi:hypothetical protein
MNMSTLKIKVLPSHLPQTSLCLNQGVLISKRHSLQVRSDGFTHLQTSGQLAVYMTLFINTCFKGFK